MAYDLQEEENHENNKHEKVAAVELTKTQSKDKKGKKDRKSPTKSKIQMGQTTPGMAIFLIFFLFRTISLHLSIDFV